MKVDPKELIAFLNGEGPLDGVWFGEPHPTDPGPWWWRKHLRALEQREVGVSEYCRQTGCVHAAHGCPTWEANANPFATPPRDVPDGFVMVPMDPTREMVEAGILFGTSPNKACIIYQSMLAAAPRPDKENGHG